MAPILNCFLKYSWEEDICKYTTANMKEPAVVPFTEAIIFSLYKIEANTQWLKWNTQQTQKAGNIASEGGKTHKR